MIKVLVKVKINAEKRCFSMENKNLKLSMHWKNNSILLLNIKHKKRILEEVMIKWIKKYIF